jgi:3-hydroxyanthranilate 3,4-dioxygenase
MAALLSPFNLKDWIERHRDLLKPPVGAEMIWHDSQFIVMIIGGPNARRDFHIDPADEFFYQLEGEMVLEYMDAGGTRRRPTIRAGDVFMLPAGTPHSPQRPAGSIGLVVERVRGPEEPESYAWFCERCESKLLEIARGTGDLLDDLKRVNDDFAVDERLRTCRNCGFMQPVPTGPRL